MPFISQGGPSGSPKFSVVPFYVGATDPADDPDNNVLTGKTWLETDEDEAWTEAVSLKVRNADNDDWVTIVGTGSDLDASLFMPKAGGTFTGPVHAPTPTPGDDNDEVATTEFVQTELDDYILSAEKGASSGVATLDGGGKVPSAQLPAVALVKPVVVADLTARLALTAQAGDVAVQTDTSKTYMLKEAGDPTVDADWIELKAPTGAAPSGASFITYGTEAGLSAERVLTDSTDITGDVGTAGQFKLFLAALGVATAAIAARAVTWAKVQAIATGKLLGRTTASSGDVEEITPSAEFDLSAGAFSLAALAVATAKIAARAVTWAKVQAISTGKLLGRTTASSGDVEEITPSARLALSAGALDLATSGASAGTYGDATNSPQLTVDAYGRITSVSNVAISGGGGGGITGLSSAVETRTAPNAAGDYINLGTITSTNGNKACRITLTVADSSHVVTKHYLFFDYYRSYGPSELEPIADGGFYSTADFVLEVTNSNYTCTFRVRRKSGSGTPPLKAVIEFLDLPTGNTQSWATSSSTGTSALANKDSEHITLSRNGHPRGALRKIEDRAVPTTVGNYIEICSVLGGTLGEKCVRLVCVGARGSVESGSVKVYEYGSPYGGAQDAVSGTYPASATLVPIIQTGPRNGHTDEYELEVVESQYTTTFRLRRTVNTNALSVRVILEVYQSSLGLDPTYTSLSGTGTSSITATMDLRPPAGTKGNRVSIEDRTLPGTVGNYVELGTLTSTANGEKLLKISVLGSNNSAVVAKEYLICDYYRSYGPVTILPIGYSGFYSTDDFELEVTNSNTTMTFRLRRTKAAGAGTFTIRAVVQYYLSPVSTVSWASSSGTGTSTATKIIDLRGSRTRAVRSETASLTVGRDDDICLMDATSGARTFTLPDRASHEGRHFILKKIDSSGNAVTVARAGSDTIDGATSKSLAAQYDKIALVAGPAEWNVIG
jgi:hypothetical protein